MNRSEFINLFASRSGLTRRDAARALDAILDAITAELTSGGQINFTGFGKFSAQRRATRMNVNPRTGEKVAIPAATVARFEPGSALKEVVKGGGGAAPRAGGGRSSGGYRALPPEDFSEPLWRVRGERKSAAKPRKKAAARTRKPARPGRSRILRRTPHLDATPEVPKPGDVFRVTVYADKRRPRSDESSTPIRIETPAGVTRVQLSVWLTLSKHFELVDEPVKTITIFTDRDESTRPTFKVKVKKRPPRDLPPTITAFFSFRGKGCGSVARQIEIAERLPAAPAPQPPRRVLVARTDVKPADLSVVITAASPEEQQTFTCTVSTPLLRDYRRPQSASWTLPRATDAFVRDYMDQFTDADATVRQRTNRLVAAGKELFQASPKIFQDVFWKLVKQGRPLKTISIVSQEPYVPWELMVPNAGATTLDPLGVTYAVGRWVALDNVSPPQQVRLKDSIAVAPVYRTNPNLPHAAEEAVFVNGLFPGRSLDPATWTTLDAAFAAGGASILHFACHGGADGKSILLAEEQGAQHDGNLTPLDLDGWQDAAKAFSTKTPLVFLNACEVGRLAPSLLGAGGFAAAFAKLGASCVVAPIWSVDDSLAHEVAEAFYQAVEASPGASLASLLGPIRKQAYDGTKADTFAAYCFFGDPDAVAAVSSR